MGKISTCNRSAETLFCREDEKVLNERVFYSKGMLPWDAIYSIRKKNKENVRVLCQFLVSWSVIEQKMLRWHAKILTDVEFDFICEI